MIIAGEASGDLYGASLAQHLFNILPNITITGIGGSKMKEAGVKLIFDASDIAVVGISEVFSKLKVIQQAFKQTSRLLTLEKPDMLILIDYPDFNLRLAKVAKKHGIPIVYYISPQVWAWRSGRIKTIAKLVNKMLVIFPFEVPLYEEAEVDVEFVGHPLIDIVKPEFTKSESCQQFKIDAKKPIIGLLPGSRKNEIDSLLPNILDSAELLSKEIPDIQFLIPVSKTVDLNEIKNKVDARKINIRLISEKAYEIMNISDILIAASGTATLEAAIIGTPMVVIYKVSLISYLLGRLLINVPYISLANLVAGKEVVPELIQFAVKPKNIKEEVMKIIKDDNLRKKIKEELGNVKAKLGLSGASQRVAEIVSKILIKDNIYESL